MWRHTRGGFEVANHTDSPAAARGMGQPNRFQVVQPGNQSRRGDRSVARRGEPRAPALLENRPVSVFAKAREFGAHVDDVHKPLAKQVVARWGVGLLQGGLR